MQIKYGTYGKYGGPFITGTRNTPTVSEPTMESSFIVRAFWLTIMAECLARFGVINMRDGTGVTAGLHQAVACYPKNGKAQGPLFKLLWRIDHVLSLAETRLGSLLAGQDWVLAGDGILVDAYGQPVRGDKFRSVVTPPAGLVEPEGGDWRTARLWARAFGELFLDERTHRAQILAGVEALQKKVCRFRAKKYLNGATIEEVVFGVGNGRNPDPFATLVSNHGVEADLAHAVLLSFAVNAPTWAFQVYNAEIKKACTRLGSSIDEIITVVDVVGDDHFVDVASDLRNEIGTPRFAKGLIRALANKGRKWDDDVKGSRYQRTRDAAMKVWCAGDWMNPAEDGSIDTDLFGDDGVMPADLVD